MGEPPVLHWTPAADSHPGPDDSDQDEDHADEDDEMSGVLTEREAGNPQLVRMRHEVVLDEIEQQAEGHHGHPEPGETRKRRAGGERRDWERIDQSAYLRCLYC
jgi:hypothetical protein